jgi:hypothetical protein
MPVKKQSNLNHMECHQHSKDKSKYYDVLNGIRLDMEFSGVMIRIYYDLLRIVRNTAGDNQLQARQCNERLFRIIR